MPALQTTRHKLPLLAVSQAQKEITHNEALVRVDALLHPLVDDVRATAPVVTDTDIGRCWLVAEAPVGEWAGKAGQIAIWIGGGWRFCSAADGMRLRLDSSGTDLIRSAGLWVTSPNIADPTNGMVVDIEARSAIVALLNHLRSIGHLTSWISMPLAWFEIFRLFPKIATFRQQFNYIVACINGTESIDLRSRISVPKKEKGKVDA
jgi:hypothetical protein